MQYLTASLQTHDGRTIPYGPDEEARGQILDASWGTQIPGGHGAGELTIARDCCDPVDVPLLSGAEFFGPGGEQVYEGRLATAPRYEDDTITLEFEGWAATLDDNLFRELYVSRNLERWQGPSTQRRDNLLAGTLLHQNDASVVTDDTAGPALRMTVSGAWDAIIPRCEAWLDAGTGLEVERIKGTFDGVDDANWTLVNFGADDDVTPVDISADIYSASTGFFDTTIGHRWVGLAWYFNATASGTEGYEHYVNIRDLAVYGSHGLTIYETEDGGPEGVLGSDVLRECLTRSCPLLNIEDIDDSTFVIPELVFDGWDSRPRAVVEQVTLLGGASTTPNDWGVYGRRFFWRAPGTYGTTHRIRFDEGVTVDGEGEDSTAVGNAMIATFTDAAGREKAYGYTGSGADYESDLLLDTDELNPISDSEVELKVITQEVGRTSPEGALLLGQLALREATQTTRTGSFHIPALASGDAPFIIRAGDKLIVEDDDELREQYVLQTSYQHSDGHLVATIGRPQPTLEVAIAQLAMATGGGWIGQPSLQR